MNLTPKEVAVIQMALSGMIDDLKAVASDPTIPLTPQARKDSKDILNNAVSAHKKIASVSGNEIKLDPYKEGDEQEFFTRQS